MQSYFAHWVFAFVFTQFVEIPIYVRGLRVRPLIAFGASALTHPVVWFVIPGIFRALDRFFLGHGARFVLDPTYRFIAFGVLCEGFAFVAEGFYFMAFRRKRPFLWSLVANGVSASVGYIFYRLTGWP